MRRLVVAGDSMLPTLRPGDRVIAVPGRLRRDQLVAVRDPRQHRRVMIKRVGDLCGGGVWVCGDNAGASTDSRHFGVLPRRLVLGRVVYRYAPPERAGWL